jgi:hypothetical protein
MSQLTDEQKRRLSQRQFASEQAEAARKLDELHRQLHPEKHPDVPAQETGAEAVQRHRDGGTS